MSEKKAVERVNQNRIGTLIFAIVSLIMLLGAFIVSISVGSVGVSPSQTLRLLFNHVAGMGNISDISANTSTIILNVRMPRVILASMTGAALSVSGAAMQGLLKNPLAEGSTLGITSGGALGAVLSIVTGFTLPFFPQAGLAVMSIISSFLSLMLILSLSHKIDGNLSTNTIILTGVIFSMMASSLTSLLVAMAGNNLKQVVFWSMGSFSGKGWIHVILMLPFFLIGTLLLLVMSRELNAFSLGEEQARYIGVNTGSVKILILVLVSVLIGISVAIAGTIGFVGLVVPHITRLLVGPDHKRLLPFSMVLGATFLMLTDLLSRTVMSPAELPIGIVTSFIGALLFIYIFYNRNRRGG